MSDIKKSGIERNIKTFYFFEFFNMLLFPMAIWIFFETTFWPVETLILFYSAQHLLIVFLEVPTGALADLIGKKKTMMLGALINFLAWVVIAFTVNPIQIPIAYGLMAVGMAFISGADSALLYDSLKDMGKEKEFAKIMSKIEMSREIAKIIGILVGGYLFTQFFRGPYILYMIALFIVFLISLNFVEPKSDSEKFSWKNYINQMQMGIKEVAKTKLTAAFGLFFVLLGGFAYYYAYFMKDAFLLEKGFEPEQMAIAFSIIYIFRTIVVYFIAKSANRKYSLLFNIFSLLLIVSFIPAFWASKSFALVLFIFGVFVAHARRVFLSQYANEIIDSKYRATALSALNLGVSLVFSLISFFSSPLISKFGSAWVLSALGFMALIFVLPISLYVSNKLKDLK
jgi:hypothetical protein